MKLFQLALFFIPIAFSTSCSEAQSQKTKEESKQTSNNEIVIGHKLKFQSNVLGEEKELYISLPPKYDEHVQSYPVIFTFEAEYLFEATQTTAKYMAARSKMPESIVVSIANSEFNKRHEASYERWNGLPDEYIQFFEEELIPFIETKYRTNDYRTIIGLSPSTGFLFECFLKQPDLFKSYIALSAHLEWDRELGSKLIDEVMSKNNDPQYAGTTFYMGRADSDMIDFDGAEEAYQEAFHRLENYTHNNVKIKIDVLEGEEHYLMSLAGIRSGLEAIYPNTIWRNPGKKGWDKNVNYADEYYKQYFDQLSELYGFDIYPIETAHGYGFSLSGWINSAQRWGTVDQIIQLAELGIQYFPNSAYMHMALAEAYKQKGETNLAIRSGEKSVQLAQEFKNENLNHLNQRLNSLRD